MPNGKLSVSFPTTVSDHKIDYRYRIEARVTDEASREIVGRGSVIATYGSFVVNVKPDRYFYSPAASADLYGRGARLRQQARAHAGARGIVPVEPARAVLWQAHGFDRRRLPAPTAPARREFAIPAAGGSYRVRVSRANARRPRGGADHLPLGLPAALPRAWKSPRAGTLQIIPDKKSYRGGETAKMLIVTGRANTPVFVTIEGRDLRSCQLIRSPDTAVQFERAHQTAPTSRASVSPAQFLRGGNLYQAIEVHQGCRRVDHQINVTLATDKPQYLPGETAHYSIQATDADGQARAARRIQPGRGG